MKLINKKTGEIVTLTLSSNGEDMIIMGNDMYAHITKLSELKDYEDYEEPKGYWYYDTTCCRVEKLNDNEDKEIDSSIGNCFETREEAELAVRKLKAWKRLKDNGFKIKGWKFTPDMKHIEGNYVKIEAEIPAILINESDIDLLFGGEE